jgi:hypothetical protein
MTETPPKNNKSNGNTSNNDENDVSAHNILRIADELVYQVDRTRKIVVIMIIALVIAIPVSWHVAPVLTKTPDSFMVAGYATIIIGAIFLGIGVRQWLLLSKWTRKYKTYKEMQRKVDEKLDFDGRR